MWNQFLNESKSERKFENTPVLVLGNKHSGKRSLIDSLFDISKTSLYSKKTVDSNKMRLKGLTPIIDYAYLNVLDVQDPDYRTHSKLEIYFVEDKFNLEVFGQLEKTKLLKKAVVIIMLDFMNPWSFMEELDQWIKFLYELQKKAGFSITELQQMANNISNYYKQYKQPEFDENGKIKTEFVVQQQDDTYLELPLPDGVLTNNIRLPFILCVNKCDLQSSVLRDESANKIQYIMYHLRKFCVQYGGSMIYTSIKNNSNLNILYEYILHRAYKMPLRFKAETVNQEAIFIPFGYDSLNLIEDSVVKMDVSKSYSEVISTPVQKKAAKQQVIVEQDAEFFKKYIATSGTPNTTTVNSSSVRQQSSESSNPRTTEVTMFFERLLRSNNSNANSNTNTNTTTGGTNDQQRRSQAQNTLLKYTKQAEQSKTRQKNNE